MSARSHTTESANHDLVGTLLAYLIGTLIGIAVVYPALPVSEPAVWVSTARFLAKPLVIGTGAILLIVVGWWLVARFVFWT